MKKNSKLVWELAVAFVALAGGLTLIKDFVPSVPAWIFSSFFAFGFIFMLVSFGWRFYENCHPAKITKAHLEVNIIEEPKLVITIGISSSDEVYIENFIRIKLDKELSEKIGQMHGSIGDSNICALLNDTAFEINKYFEKTLELPIYIKHGFTKQDLTFENINYSTLKTTLSWSMIGARKEKLSKMSCSVAQVWM